MVGVPLAPASEVPDRAKAREELGASDEQRVLTIVQDRDAAACPTNADALEQVCASLRQQHSNLRIMDQDGHDVPRAGGASGDTRPAGEPVAAQSGTAADALARQKSLRTQLLGSDLVVARPTATMCGELLAAAAPAVLMPRKVREDCHDRFNAQAMDTLGVAVVAPCAVIGGVDSIEDDAAEDSADEDDSTDETEVASNSHADEPVVSAQDAAEALRRYGPGKRAQRLFRTEQLISSLLEDSGRRRMMQARAEEHARDQAARVIAEALVAIAGDHSAEDIAPLQRYKEEALQRTIAIATRMAAAENAKSGQTVGASLGQ